MNRYPQDLIDAFNANEVVAIIGSGPSVAAGLPAWPQLLRLMIDECAKQLVGFKQTKELRSLLRKGHLLEVADECSKRLGGQLYRDFIQRLFRNPAVRPVRLHELIVQPPFSAILTTNYDDLLERAYVSRHRTDAYPLVYSQDNIAQLPRLASEKRFFILKLHGDANNIETLVLTKTDYANVIHRSEAYRAVLSSILATHTALFIGYGLRDHDLNLILGEQAALFRSFGRRHYAFLPNPGTVLPKSLLDHYNITVIPYQARHNHSELEVLLGGLQRHIKVVEVKDGSAVSRQVRRLMEIEREFCVHLNTKIEYERARFLKLHAEKEKFSADDIALIEKSIQYHEERNTEKQSLENQLAQTQKMGAIGQLAGGVAHDFNNILAAIQGYCQLVLGSDQLPDSVREYLKEISEAATRAASLTRQLLAFSRNQFLETKMFDFGALVASMGNMLRRLIGEDIELDISIPPEKVLLDGDQGKIEQVILNLVINARDALTKSRRISVRVERVNITDSHLMKSPEARIGNFWCLSVVDTGCGMEPEVLSRAFEPFFTTKSPGRGTGLGLSVVYGIIKQHNGWISMESKAGQGTSVFVYLPEAGETKPFVRPEAGGIDLRGTAHVLLVEDDRAVRRSSARILQSHGYTVLEAENAKEASALWDEHHDTIDLLLTDIVMPGGDGFALSLALTKSKPNLKVLYITGYSGQATIDLRPDLAREDNFLQKPFKPNELLTALHIALNTSGSNLGSV